MGEMEIEEVKKEVDGGRMENRKRRQQTDEYLNEWMRIAGEGKGRRGGNKRNRGGEMKRKGGNGERKETRERNGKTCGKRWGRKRKGRKTGEEEKKKEKGRKRRGHNRNWK